MVRLFKGIFRGKKVKFNNPWTIKTEEGKTMFPTRIAYDEWVNERILTEGIDNLSLPSQSEFEITKISDRFDLRGLAKSKRFPQLGTVLDHIEAINKIKKIVPVDNTEIVEWLQETGAMNAILDARMEEYNKYSQMVVKSGDGNIPGVFVCDMRFYGVSGYTVCSQGYTPCQTPLGTIRCTNNRGTLIMSSNFIGWAGVKAGYSYQWNGCLAKWNSIANTPITNKVGFINFHGIIAPQFFVQRPPQQTEAILCSIRLGSASDQSVKIVFRDPNDYTRVLDEATINVSRGEYSINYGVASYPAVPPILVEIQPSTNTTMNSFTVNAR